MTDLSRGKDLRTASERIADYEKTVSEIERNVAMRFTRGNVRIQLGQFITADELEAMSKKADEDIASLKKAIAGK